MNNENLEILTNKYIDKELTDSEKQELESLLLEENNRKYFDSMTSLIKQVENIQHSTDDIDVTIAVTSKLKNNIEEAGMKKNKSWLSELFNGQKIGYGISFAMGAILIGIITLFQQPQNNLDDEFLSGTLANNFDETFFIDRQPLNGSVKLKYSEGLVILDISLKSERLVNCELIFDKNALAFYGVKNLEPGKGSQFSSSRNGVYLSAIESDHYLVFLRVLKKTNSNISAKFFDGITELENILIKVNN